MLDIKYIRENADLVQTNAENKRMKVDIPALLALDERRLESLKEIELIRKERNEIAEKMKSASADERPNLIEKGKALKETLAKKETEYDAVESEWKTALLAVPNMTHPDAPIGASDEDNVEKKVFGEIPSPSFTPKSHVELAEMHDLIDFERGAKVAGAKFYFLKGKLAMLEQALTQWTLKLMVEEGYTPMITPDLARDEVLLGAGFTPRGDETQIYSVENTDLS
ncbi:MAG: serine--tRNA ligase, partial [Candidatus Uhrbacteria bacterium]|nr:serine--tRNA ligase [Candidatus Uhrbacteria bacterium]